MRARLRWPISRCLAESLPVPAAGVAPPTPPRLRRMLCPSAPAGNTTPRGSTGGAPPQLPPPLEPLPPTLPPLVLAAKLSPPFAPAAAFCACRARTSRCACFEARLASSSSASRCRRCPSLLRSPRCLKASWASVADKSPKHAAAAPVWAADAQLGSAMAVDPRSRSWTRCCLGLLSKRASRASCLALVAALVGILSSLSMPSLSRFKLSPWNSPRFLTTGAPATSRRRCTVAPGTA
mmetsp:Transcript_29791/g.81716  ORF Transcript_29791/g.81716 Transcript_29791/m.81716 type:complete len:237 (-) Transcript_29791:1209-1919(-)